MGNQSEKEERQDELGPGKNEKNDAGEKNKSSAKINPVRLLTIVVLLISIMFLVWYILSDRHVPYSDQAKVNGLMSPIVPRVSGNITKIFISLHRQIAPGDTLFQIDPRPYQLAVERAEARLDNTAQSVAARTASVKSSIGRLGVARAQLDRAQRNWTRVQTVLKENPGALSLSDRDAAETSLMQATEQVASAEADLERAQQALGFSGEENATFRSSVKALEQAQLELAFTTIIAASPGFIESLSIDLGFYAAAGQPLATLVTRDELWIQANMKENNLSHMQPGDPVEFILDVDPGKVYKGQVRSIGYGVSTGNANRGDLPSITGQTGWLRDPQRFPVIITFNRQELGPLLRLGGQADVIVYTNKKKHPFLKAIGRFRIRLNSWLSYAR